jgi:hypothetical protein
MSYTAIQTTPITVDLKVAAVDTGWSLLGDGTAKHETCNAGNLRLLDYVFTSGVSYKITYQILSISNGYVQFNVGDAKGTQHTVPGSISEIITPSATGMLGAFFSNANCIIKELDIQPIIDALTNEDTNTVVWSTVNKRWSDFRSYVFDCGYSLFTNNYVFNSGTFNKMENASTVRNNFFGVQYQSRIKFIDAVQPLSVKTFESISVQSNQLMVTTTGGITTSLGHVSELAQMDFLKDILLDNIISMSVYSKEGVYSANFLRDKNDDLISGQPLKGNWITVELTTTANNAANPIKLFSVQVIAAISKIGAR